MSSRITSLGGAVALAVLGLAAAGCGQGASNGANGTAGNAATTNSANNSTAATPAAAPAPSLSPATGPLAIASDANLPEQCRTYISESQACLDAIPGAADGMNPHMLRSTVNNDRTTWSREQTPELLAAACTRHLERFRGEKSRYSC